MRVEHDLSRFKQIVRGKIRQNLRKYITHGELIGRKGRDLVSIPLPQLDVPHFRYGKNGAGGFGIDVAWYVSGISCINEAREACPVERVLNYFRA